jgi:hypothetical protein
MYTDDNDNDNNESESKIDCTMKFDLKARAIKPIEEHPLYHFAEKDRQ